MIGVAKRLLGALGRDRRGVSAVEFALIAPFLIFLFIGSFELTRAVNINRQTALLSRTVSDFVSQQESVNATMLNNILVASTAVMYPYPTDAANLSIEVESITTTKDGSMTQWSYPNKITVPKKSGYEGVDGLSVIKTSVSYKPSFIFTFLIERLNLKNFTLEESTFMAPRLGKPIEFK